MTYDARRRGVSTLAGVLLAAGRVVGCWWLIAAAAIIAWIPFERSRYVLPLVPPSLLAAGWLVAVALPTWGRGVWQRGPRAAA